MLQAANRVGRGNDKCERIIVGKIGLVDTLASCVYKKKLLQFVYNASAKPVPRSPF